MELNREQIIKALECLNDKHDRICDACPVCRLTDRGHRSCKHVILDEAVALIKELTEENERLRGERDAYTILNAELKERKNELQEANEELGQYCKELEKAFNEQMNFYCSFTKSKTQNCPIDDEVTKAKADTVRKMQERLKQAICDNTYPDFNGEGKPINVWKATTGYDLIDQIAKELLEGL